MKPSDVIEKALKNYKKKKSIVDTIELRIEAYERMLEESQEESFTVSFPSEIGMPRSPGYGGSPTERTAIAMECNREDIKEIIKNDKSRLFWPKLEIDQIEKSLEALTTWEKFIIECKYFDGMSWRNIEISFNKQFPQKNDITEGRIRQINSEATDKIVEILNPFYQQYETMLKLPESYQKISKKIAVQHNSKVYTYSMGQTHNDTLDQQ
jgi:hypothetical protein